MLRENWFKWLPWKYVVRRVARAHGFIDPVTLLANLHRFAQPSEVAEPIELLRAGVVFHARGLMNTKAIQHNLDWVWPYWVERQFDPHDDAFIPRAFSITHVNLTHRNWTAVGLPGYVQTPLVDPRGLVMPLWDSWSVDAWIIESNGKNLLPSRNGSVVQRLELENNLTVNTKVSDPGLSIQSKLDMTQYDGELSCRIRYKASSLEKAWFVISLRPYNPEGVSFINSINLDRKNNSWLINKTDTLWCDTLADEVMFSDYATDDVFSALKAGKRTAPTDKVECRVGMATAAALYLLEPGIEREISVHIPLPESKVLDAGSRKPGARVSWPEAVSGVPGLVLPDEKFEYIFKASVHTLVVLSPFEVYPGPFTYKRFWFRDAVFIMQALLVLGFTRKVEELLNVFPERQTFQGYFLSQEGEWDSNGQVLWSYYQFCSMTCSAPREEWLTSIKAGAEWIINKREDSNSGLLHEGLLPAGFSAEHLGLNDHYYWDNFWAIAGLECASKLFAKAGNVILAKRYSDEAISLSEAIETSLTRARERRSLSGIPASPYRRMDSGAIGSIIAGYPLKLWKPDEPRLLSTVRFLMQNCSYKGAFFQDMIHSGVNPYLSLHIAQVLLRAGEDSFFDIFSVVAEAASSTGQWPEAIHPRTGGGCMGDGQHSWASAEWILMQRNCFVREEGEALILASGLPKKWLEMEREISFGPTLTAFGPVSVSVKADSDGANVSWESEWHTEEPQIEIRLPGHFPLSAQKGDRSVRVLPESSINPEYSQDTPP